jgi:ABC-2 type transport system ATP-binding protein
MSDIVVQSEGLTKAYGSKTALDDLDLKVERGEIFGFLGHNGAGKTTTIHMLTTLLKPTSGTATVCGQSITRQPMQVRRHIGYVPEHVRLYDTLSARDNLRFFARLSGIDAPDRRIDETLDFLDCAELAPQRVGTFSKGLRQRIGLAQAILHRPEVLFLDEPTSGLDPMGIRMLRELIVRLNAEFGITIFMNTHLISEISRTCTTIGVLNRGELVFRDSIEAATKRLDGDDTLEDLYMAVTPAEVREAAQ